MRRSVALLRNDFLPLLPESPALDLTYRLVAVLDEASAHARRLRSPQPPGINFRHLTHHCLALRNPSRPLPPGPVGPADPPAVPRRAPPGPWLPCSSRWPSSRPRGLACHGRHKTTGLGFLFSVTLSFLLCSVPLCRLCHGPLQGVEASIWPKVWRLHEDVRLWGPVAQRSAVASPSSPSAL